MTADELPLTLRHALAQLAPSPRLLIACDYDGTLAPLVGDPNRAFPRPESMTALRLLAGLADTTVAVISGRALRDLVTLSRLPGEVHLVGSHGSEFDAGYVHGLEPAVRQLLQRLHAELIQITDGLDGVSLEVKPASVAVHVRRAAPDVAQRAVADVLAGPCTWDGVQVTEGKAVVELAVVPTDKGLALDVLRHQVGATAAVFFGDDVTDEKAFAASLHMGLSGLIDPRDERFAATVTAIEAELRSGSTVYRYKHDDGLPGGEGGFHLCAAWMVEAYLACGRRTEAGSCSSSSSRWPGPPACSPRSTTRWPNARWATIHRPTPTSA